MAELPPNYIAQRRQEEIQKEQRENSSWILPFAAGIGAIALGAKLYRTSLNRGGGVIPNLLHFLGHPTALTTNVDKIANSGASTPASGASGIRSVLSSIFNIRRNELQLGPIDLVNDVRSSLNILGSASADEGRNLIRNRLTEFVNRRHVNYGNNTSFFGENLQRVTVSEVLANEATWTKTIGETSWKTLKEGVEAGILRGTTVLDKGIVKTNKGNLLDIRLRNILLKPNAEGTRLVPRIDIFGQGSLFQSLVGESAGVAVLKPTAEFRGPRFFVGGNIYGYAREGKNTTEVLLATGTKLRRLGDRLEPIRAAREGRLELNVRERSGFFGGLLSRFEQATGVGTSFSNRTPFISAFIINPIKRLSGLARGRASIYEVSGGRNFAETVADMAVGAEIPEMFSQTSKVGTIVRGGVDFSGLSLLDKLAILLDKSSKFKLVKAEKDAAIAARLKSGTKRPIGIKEDELFTALPGKGGFTIKNADKLAGGPFPVKSEYYAAPTSKVFSGITSIRDFTSYLAYRTSNLASASLLGISYAPAKTFLGNMTRVAAVPMIYGAGMEALEYADYTTEKLTGVSPKKTIASVYAGIRVNQQEFRKKIGIQEGLKSLEENYPGSVESGLATILRSIVAPLATFSKLSRVAGIPTAAAGAGAVFALIGGPSPGQDPQELREEYSGQRKVAIRKGRFWGMGNTPFEGGEISRYDYSWYHKLMSDYRYKSIYGSKDEYFTYHSNVFGIPFPTIQNLGGIRNIVNPYRLEQLQAQNRPYDVTSPMFENVPVFGPILASTIGSLIKPRIERTDQTYLSRLGVLPGGLDPQTAKDLGIDDLNATAPALDNIVARVQKMANVALEPLGVYKFALEFFGVSFSPTFQERAESAMIDSPARQFYSMQLGGMFGQTEFLRRFMLSDYGVTANTAAMVGTINNAIPDWLPGSNSKFERDKSYFIDFSVGDPFLKLEDAESRLPGPGYEALNVLHSKRPGVYDAVDRLLILADVAPYSQALKAYEKEVARMDLSPEDRARVERAMQYKKGMTSIEDRYPRHVNSLLKINNEITSGSPIYNVTRNLYDFVTHDILAEIPWIGTKLAPFRDPYEKYRKQYVEGSEYASWFHPYEDIVRPTLIDAALSNPFIGAIKGAGTALMLSGPMKFINPLARYEQGSSAFSIGTVAAGAAVGAGLSTSRILAGLPENYVPAHIREESRAIEYSDKLTYLKYRSLEAYSTEMGLTSQAAEFKKMQRKTMVGASNPIAVRAALPRSVDKKYFDIFVRAPEEKREELMAGLPPFMSSALQKVYSSSYGGQTSADLEVADYFSTRDIPSPDFLGYHPSVDIPSLKFKVINHGMDGISDNYHRFGFYESHERTLRQAYPDLYSSSISYTSPVNFADVSNVYQNLGRNIVGSLSSNGQYNGTAYGGDHTVRLQIDKRKELKNQYLRELR